MSSRRLSPPVACSGGGSFLSVQPPPLLPLPPVGENWFYYDYFFFSVADLEEGCVRESGRGEEKIPVGWMGCVIRGLDFALFKTDLGLRLL